MVADYVEGLEKCYYYSNCDECSVTAVAYGELVEGTCDDM
jgi:hypothetical protein